LGTRDPKEARRLLTELIREQHRRPTEKLTVAEVWADYVAEKEAEGKSSVARMRDAWKRLHGDFGDARPDVLSADSIRSYIGSRRGHGASDGTIHTELGYLRAALRHAGYNPSFKLPSKPRPRSRHLTPDEARRLIDAATMPHLRLYLLLALYTAGRPSSILDLEWDRVDFARRQIRLDNPSKDRTAKGRAIVPMAAEIEQPLKDAKAAALTPWVIEWAGKKVASVKKGIRSASSRAGLPLVTPYMLRHTSAVWLAEAGVPMAEIAQYMGHTSPNVTYRTYARFSPDYLRKASDAISTALSGQPLTTDREPSVNETGSK
jgi:integrase